MVRKKIKIKRIENSTARQVTFSKRRRGLFKKAHDLSVLCDAEVGVIVFSGKGKLFEFASPSMGSVLERYVKSCGELEARDNNNSSDNAVYLDRFNEKLKASQSNLIGNDFERLSSRDLIHLEQQISNSLRRIHRKKEELLLEQLQHIKEKVTEAQRETNVNSSMLEKLLDFGPSKVTGFQMSRSQAGSEQCCTQDAPQVYGSFSVWSDISELTSEVLGAAKCSIITDLNKSPAGMEDE